MVVVATEAIGVLPTIPDDEELEDTKTDDVPIMIVEVLVSVVVEPPSIVLVRVIKVVDVKIEEELGD